MIKKIPVDRLQKGMYVCGNDRKWLDTPFFRTKFMVNSDEQIKALKEYYQFVFIDTDKGRDVGNELPDAIRIRYGREIAGDDNDPILTLYFKTIEQLKELGATSPAENQASHDNAVLEKLVGDLLPCVKNRLERILPLVLDELDQQDPERQAVNNCILGLVLGVRLRFHDELNKTLGVQLLAVNFSAINFDKAEKSFASSWLFSSGDVVETVSVFNRLRQEREGGGISSVLAALQCMHSGQIAELKSYLVKKFIESIGIYPSGSVVELNNGQLAVVELFQISPRQIRLRVVSDAQKKLLGHHQLLELPGKDSGSTWIAGTLAFDDPITGLIIQHCEMVGCGI